MRWASAWVLFWLGDLVSKCDRIDSEWFCNLWFPVYRWLMVTSSRIQGPGLNGPWGVPDNG